MTLRVVRWVPTVWLTFVIIRYCETAWKSIHAPLVPGADIPWAIGWIAFLMTLALSTVFLEAQTVFRLWFGLTSLVTAVMLILSHTWSAAVMAGVVLLITAGLGEFVLQRFGVKAASILERSVVTVPLGIGLLALTQLTVALLGHFNRTTSWLILAAFTIPAAAGLRSAFRTQTTKRIGVHPLLVLPICWLFFLNLLWAMAPEVQFDATSVHLAVPRLYLEHGGVFDLNYFFHSYFAHLLDMVFGLCLAIGGLSSGPIVAKFLILAFGLIATYGVFAIGLTLFSAEVGAWAALIFYSTPLVIWSSGTTYMDLAETCFIVASIVAFIRWFETGSVGWLAACGWTGGVATGTKLHALTLLAPIPFAIAWYASKRWNQSAVRAVLIWAVLFAVVAAPWFGVIYAYTGNPLYPFMNAVFHSPQWPNENTRLDADAFGTGTSAQSLIRLPFRLTWNSNLFGDALPRGGVGFALLLAFPLAFLFPVWTRGWRSPLVGVLLCGAALHLMIWATSFQYARYFIPGLPLLAVLGCAVFIRNSAPGIGWHRALLFLAIVAQAPLASTMFWNVFERFPIDHALGKETDDSLLARTVKGYNAAKYINSVSRPGEQVVGIGLENVRFYLNAPLQSLAEAPLGQKLQDIGKANSPSELAAMLRGLGYKYAITSLSDLDQPALFYRWLQPEFRQHFEKEVYRDDSVAVLKLCYTDCD